MRRTIMAIVVAVLALVALAPGARAAACTDTWTGGAGVGVGGVYDWDTAGNWTSGVPATGAEVCIASGAPTLTAGGATPNHLASLQVTGGSLTVDIHNPLVSASTTISPGATVTLNGTYTSANAGNASLGGGPVSNQGTITMEGGGYSATLYGTVTNTGTIDVLSSNVSFGQGGNGGTGSLVNEGTISIAAPSAANTNNEPGVTADGFPITNAGGTITNGATFVVAGANGTTGSFTEAAGTVTGNPINFQRGSSLAFTGAGASSFSVGPCIGAIPMSGNISSGQSLDVEIGSAVEEPASFSNAGGVVLDGTYQGSGCGSPSILTDSGTFTNAGAITVQGSPYNGTLTGAVVNQGTIAVVPGSELEQTSGSFTNGGAGILVPDISSSALGVFRFDSGTTFTSGGTLAPTLQGGFTPSVGQEFDVVAGATLTGRFASVRAPFGADYSKTGEIQAVYGSGTVTPPPTSTARRPVRVTRVRGGRGVMRLTLSCPAGGSSCRSASVRATVVERFSGRRLAGVTTHRGKRTRAVTIAVGRVSGLGAGRARTLTLHLDALGRRLLRRFHRLPVTVSVTQGATTTRHRVEVVAPRRRHRR